jgi:hypothetical protein
VSQILVIFDPPGAFGLVTGLSLGTADIDARSLPVIPTVLTVLTKASVVASSICLTLPF